MLNAVVRGHGEYHNNSGIKGEKGNHWCSIILTEVYSLGMKGQVESDEWNKAEGRMGADEFVVGQEVEGI